MISRWLINILALVIVLQSVVAIGDAIHADHSPALDHAHTHAPHGHSHDAVTLDKNTLESESLSTANDPSQDQPADHNHHTHAQFQIMLNAEGTNTTILVNGAPLSDYQVSHTSVSLPSLLRPPIA
jgi:ABC-type nickel/cobalt efflux system permease component RcnA